LKSLREKGQFELQLKAKREEAQRVKEKDEFHQTSKSGELSVDLDNKDEEDAEFER